MVTIRALAAADANAFRDLRLEALRDSPAAFSSSYEDEARFAREDFVRRIEPSDESWVLGAFDSQNVMVACIGWYRFRGGKVAHKSHVWGMYVTPPHRRKGIARALIAEALARARAHAGITQIELFVATGNGAAASLYESLGFERVAVHPNALRVDGRYINEELFVLRIA